MNKRLIISALLVVIGTTGTKAQLPTFHSPLGIPLSLAGNFMELRSDHFHSGLDLRTDSREGLPVKAAGAGWVSRIKVSPWGYGKALYIDHPNGYTTVYGHLKDYNGAISKAALDAQYKAHDFEVDVTFAPGELPVKDGELVALSGNTGGSSGPHLHFEVRRTSDQHALDPETFGLQIPDSVPPRILGVRIDPLDSTARVAPYPDRAKGFAVVQEKGVYRLKAGAAPAAIGTVGISVNTVDMYSNSWSSCGIRSISVSVDGQPAFSAHLDEIDFGVQRYADAYMDYALFKGSDMNYNRCYRLPNNKLAIYGKEAAQGRIIAVPGQDRSVHVEVVDAHGNKSALDFTLHGATAEESIEWSRAKGEGIYCRNDKDNTITTADARLTLPPLALYADERVFVRAVPAPALKKGQKAPKLYSPRVRVHDPMTPMQLAGDLSLKLNGAAPKATDKLLLVRLNAKGAPSPVGGTYAEGWVRSKMRGFGDYAIMQDSVPPRIIPVNLKPSMAGKSDLTFRIGDDLSGVDQWKGTWDGEWILFEYDPKKNLLTHRFDAHSSGAGKHVLVMELRDERGNRTEFKTEVMR